MISVKERLTRSIGSMASDKPISISGRVSKYDGQMVECDGFPATIGSLCQIETETDMPATAEIIGFHR